MGEQANYRDFVAGIEQMPPKVVIEIPREAFVSLIAAAQLVLRHPGLGVAVGSQLRAFVDQSIEHLPAQMQASLRAGDDPSQDHILKGP
jgi:hypothetical protein